MNTCEFYFIEFTDTTYFLGIKLGELDYAVTGQYELNEDSEGNVSSVDLYYFTGEADVVIATLTDINVVEVNDEIDATFTVNLTIPDTATFDACNELSGTYSDVGKKSLCNKVMLLQTLQQVLRQVLTLPELLTSIQLLM